MKRFVFIFLFPLTAFAQGKQEKINCPKPNPFANVQMAQETFSRDSIAGHFRLYVLGGIVSAIGENDRKFEKEFPVTYCDFGCVAPADFTFYIAYNERVLRWLKAKYGDGCIEKVNGKILRERQS